MTPAAAALLLKGVDFGMFMMQFSAERQKRMREQVAAIPASFTPEQVDGAFARISAEALDEAQASVDQARERLHKIT